MDLPENFLKINLNNKNLDLEISKSRFFNILQVSPENDKIRMYSFDKIKMYK